MRVPAAAAHESDGETSAAAVEVLVAASTTQHSETTNMRESTGRWLLMKPNTPCAFTKKKSSYLRADVSALVSLAS